MAELQLRNTKIARAFKDDGDPIIDMYLIERTKDNSLVGNITMQTGPVKMHGVNGASEQDLLEIAIMRLERFQRGKFPCPENAMALAHLNAAYAYLEKRTIDRIGRGVEGEEKA